VLPRFDDFVRFFIAALQKGGFTGQANSKTSMTETHKQFDLEQRTEDFARNVRQLIKSLPKTIDRETKRLRDVETEGRD
jgi:hypothetical protein